MAPILLALIAVWLFFGATNEVFLSYRNLSFLSVQIVVTATIGLALLFVLILGEIDLAVVGTSAVAATVAASLAVNADVPAALAILAAVATGAVIGFAQGLVVIFTRSPSFIVSLGTSLILSGALLYLLPPTGLISLVDQPLANLTITYLPYWLGYVLAAAIVLVVLVLRVHAFLDKRRHGLPAHFGREVLGVTLLVAIGSACVVAVLNGYRGVPTPLAILLGLVVLSSYVTTQTTFGLHLYAIGTNAEAARRAGIRVPYVRLVAFMVTGMIGAFGGIIAAGRILSVSTESASPTLLLQAIAATVIGGASLFGGRGSVWSPLVGAIVVGSIANGMLLLDASTEARLAVQGAILIAAIAMDSLISKWGRPSAS
ncbi:MAG: hypothetical protein KDJ88_03640 [Bauldia sp.]|nr:hypothetical protein [Bauldia sp.]